MQLKNNKVIFSKQVKEKYFCFCKGSQDSITTHRIRGNFQNAGTCVPWRAALPRTWSPSVS